MRPFVATLLQKAFGHLLARSYVTCRMHDDIRVLGVDGAALKLRSKMVGGGQAADDEDMPVKLWRDVGGEALEELPGVEFDHECAARNFRASSSACSPKWRS